MEAMKEMIQRLQRADREALQRLEKDLAVLHRHIKNCKDPKKLKRLRVSLAALDGRATRLSRIMAAKKKTR